MKTVERDEINERTLQSSQCVKIGNAWYWNGMFLGTSATRAIQFLMDSTAYPGQLPIA